MMELYEIAILTIGLILLAALIGALAYIFWKKKKKTTEDQNLEEVIIHRPETEHQRREYENTLERTALLIVLMALKGSLEYFLSEMENETEEHHLEEVTVH